MKPQAVSLTAMPFLGVSALCLFCMLAAATTAFAGSARGGEAHDFRDIKWGMSRAEVMSREKSLPLTEEDKQGSRIVYFSSSLYGLKADLSYTFTRDKCWYARYEVRSGSPANVEDLKRVYRQVEEELHKRYGGPYAILDQEYDAILGRAWKTRDADISLYLHPAVEQGNRLELSLSFLCRDLMYEVFDINSMSPAYGF